MSDDKLQIQSDVYLQRDSSDAVLLFYRNGVYKPADVVPIDIYPYPPRKNKNDARAFVATSMQRAHGPSRRDWPPLAKAYLSIGAESKKTRM